VTQHDTDHERLENVLRLSIKVSFPDNERGCRCASLIKVLGEEIMELEHLEDVNAVTGAVVGLLLARYLVDEILMTTEGAA
jgi:hypothetical protein